MLIGNNDSSIASDRSEYCTDFKAPEGASAEDDPSPPNNIPSIAPPPGCFRRVRQEHSLTGINRITPIRTFG